MHWGIDNSGPVGSRRRARDARRPARTASDINLRSFVTLSLRAGLPITAPNAESYYSVRRKKNHKKRFFGTPYGFFLKKNFFPNSCYFPRQYGPVRSQKAADLKKMRAQTLRARESTSHSGTGLECPLLLPLARAHYRQSLDHTAVCFGPLLERRREAFVDNERFQIFLGNARCCEQRRGASQSYYRFRAE